MSKLVRNLPHAQGRGFATLDEYLDHLKDMAAQDRPYYEEISPGLYRLIVGRRFPGDMDQDDKFTRTELLVKFGFDC